MTVTEDVRRWAIAEAKRERRMLADSRTLDREIAWFCRDLASYKMARPVSVAHQVRIAQMMQLSRRLLDGLLEARTVMDAELDAAGLLEASRG